MGDRQTTQWGRRQLSPTRGRPQMSQGGGWARISPRQTRQEGEGPNLRVSGGGFHSLSSSSSSSSSSSTTQKSKIDWDALDDDEEEEDKVVEGGGKGKPIDWDALSEEEEEEEEEERKKQGASSFDWDALSDEEEGGGGIGGRRGTGKGKSIDWDALDDDDGEDGGKEEGMFDYLDALLSDDEEEGGEGGKKEGGGKGVNWDALSDDEGESEEKKKRDEQLRAKIFAALDEEMEQEQQYQQEQKKKRMSSASSFTSSFSAPKSKKMFSSRSPNKGRDGEGEDLLPSIPCYMASYIIDVWAKANPNFEKTIKQGYLNKAGPSKKTSLKVFHRRWVVLTDTHLSYYEKFGDHEPKGGFPISSVQSVRDSSDSELAGIGFEVVTPNRLFLFSAESPDSQKEWIRTLLMASSTARRGGGGGEGGGEGGREVVLKCSCEGFTKLVKAEVGVEYEVLREKLKEKFAPMFPGKTTLREVEIYLPSEKVWLNDVVVTGGVVSDYLTAGRSTVVELKRR